MIDAILGQYVLRREISISMSRMNRFEIDFLLGLLLYWIRKQIFLCVVRVHLINFWIKLKNNFNCVLFLNKNNSTNPNKLNNLNRIQFTTNRIILNLLKKQSSLNRIQRNNYNYWRNNNSNCQGLLSKSMKAHPEDLRMN